MNTYYTLNLTEDERNCILDFLKLKIVWSTSGNASSWENIERKLTNAEPHPNIEDVYQYEAEHTGFTEGEKVLLECTIISSADHVSTVAVHHLAATPGEVLMVSNTLLTHAT